MSKEIFKNNIQTVFYNPLYLYRRYLYANIEKYAKTFSGTTLDFGCGSMPYKHLFTNTQKYIGLDIETSGNPYARKPDILYDGKKIPLENNSVDNVFMTEVLEHIFNPLEVITEINRVLKTDGQFLITCPFTIFEHEVPYDYARYSSFGLTAILKQNGFEIVEFIKTGSYLSTILQLIACYIHFAINKIPILNYILFLLLITPLFLLALFCDILPNTIKRKDLYLNNIVLARKVNQVD